MYSSLMEIFTCDIIGPNTCARINLRGKNLKKPEKSTFQFGNIWLLSWDKPIQKFSLHHSHTGVLLSCVPKDEGEVNLKENHSLLREEKLSDENIDKTLFLFFCNMIFLM